MELAAGKRERYGRRHGALDERAAVRLGNVAYAAGLALLLAHSREAGPWLRRAARRWRESWALGAGVDAWGRPVGALKAALLVGDEGELAELARWTLSLHPEQSASPIGRYAAALALLAAGRAAEARPHAEWLEGRDDFPQDVAAALAAIAAADQARLDAELRSIVASFEQRDQHLEDVPVADTALALERLARRLGLAPALPASPTLPS